MIEHILNSSLKRRVSITIIYNSSKGLSKRNISVIEISDAQVRAYCHLRKQFRLFNKNNILAAEFINLNNTTFPL